jgi:hypothetical protein
MTNGGYISGTPTTVGTYTFRLTVTKTTFMTCYQDFTLVVSAPICTITSDSPLPSGTVGTPYSTQLTVDAAATVTGWTISNGTLPNGLTMDATGLITGTPTDVQSMTFTVSVTGTDGMTCSKAFTLNTIMVCTIAARVLPNLPANASVSGTNLTLHSGQDSCIIIEATPSVIQGVSGSWNYVGDTQILPGVYVSNVVTQNFCSGYYPGAPIGVLVVGTCGVFNAPTGSAAFTVRATKLDGTYCEQTFTVNVV